jgi:hypothetical protein
LESPLAVTLTQSRLLAAAAAGIAIAAALFLAAHRPEDGGPFPPCLFHLATGLYCPGCGGTRAAYLALHGDIVGALSQNALCTLAFPAATGYLAALLWFALSGRWLLRWEPKFRSTIVLVGILLVFAVLRNFAAFAFLAPKPLPTRNDFNGHPVNFAETSWKAF